MTASRDFEAAVGAITLELVVIDEEEHTFCYPPWYASVLY